MAKRSGIKQDVAQNALRVVEEAIDAPLVEKTKDPAAVSLGRRGGLKGGKARAANLSRKRLSEIGKQGAAARWKPKSH